VKAGGGGGGCVDGGDRDAEECGDASSLRVELLARLAAASTGSAGEFIAEAVNSGSSAYEVLLCPVIEAFDQG
jgi:hypothetical protein